MLGSECAVRRAPGGARARALTGARAGLVAALVAGLVAGLLAGLLLAVPAGAQAGNPPPRPADDSPAFLDAAKRATTDLATEAELLDVLGGFGSPAPPELRAVLDHVDLEGADDRAARLATLDDVDRDGQRARATLVANPAPPSPEVALVLDALSTADRDAVGRGERIAIAPEVYLQALDDLVFRKGRPALDEGHPIDPEALGQALDVIVVGVPTPAPTGTNAPIGVAGVDSNPPPPRPGTTLALPVVVVLVVAAAAATGGAIVAIGRRRRRRAAESAAGAPTTDDLTGLLEVSRRLASATSVGAVERATTREALDLVSAVAGAVVRQRNGRLAIGFESDDLLDAANLEGGIVREACASGEAATVVTSTDPSLRRVPAAVVAVPIGAAGAVEAVLVLVRDATHPFTAKERDLLVALAPITAAALESARHADALAEASLVDGLTGVGNRRRLDTELPELLGRFEGSTSALMMVDLDHFKTINDRHGHPVGDVVLRKVATLLEQHVRPADRVYRYGGEEFSVILPDVGRDEAEQIAQRVTHALRDRTFSVGLDEPLRLTISVGVALTEGTDAIGLVHRADAALYEAKQAGRDRVVVSR